MDSGGEVVEMSHDRGRRQETAEGEEHSGSGEFSRDSIDGHRREIWGYDTMVVIRQLT